MQDKTLLKMFREYNRAYFNGAIEEPDVLEYKVMKDKAGNTSWTSQGSTCLYIHANLKSFYRLTQVILLHEMAHLALGPEYLPQHGTR